MPVFDFYWTTLAECGIASFVLYLYMMATVIRYRKSTELRSSFFRLWLSMGVADSFQFVHSYFLMRLPLLSVFIDFYTAHDSGIIPLLGISLTYYYLFVQLFGNCLYALNRYTTLAKPTQHEEMWSTNHRLVKAIALQWLLPIPLVLQFVRESVTFMPLPDGSLLLHPKPEDEFINATISTVTIFVCTVFCTVIYFKSIFKLLALKKSMVGQDANALKQRSIELRLTIAAVMVFIGMVALCIFDILLSFYSFMGNSDMVQKVISNFYILNDFFAMINPWSLLFTSSAIRKYMLKMVGISPKQTRIVAMGHGTNASGTRSLNVSVHA